MALRLPRRRHLAAQKPGKPFSAPATSPTRSCLPNPLSFCSPSGSKPSQEKEEAAGELPAEDGRAAEAQLFHLDRPVRRSYYRRSICACPTHVPYPQAPPANIAHAPRGNNAGFDDDDAWEPLPPLIPGPESITVVPYPRRRIPRAWRRTVEGDGSCFFHAVGQWTGEPAQALRDRVCDYGQQQLTDDDYMPYMDNLMEDEDWEAGDVLPRIERFEKMREPGRFADYLDVKITATVLRRPIAVLVRAR